ncbi:MAG: tyrosine-type recombinase/integrase, partial [Proteobacteria bacterium]|nr:tyrosine-type recombinase/integrase [Pseudomonadota bacterium]
IEHCTPHTLRHTCASWMVMEGRSLMEVRDILGHSTVKMTERYAHLAPERLREAVSVLETGRTFAVPSSTTRRLRYQ